MTTPSVPAGTKILLAAAPPSPSPSSIQVTPQEYEAMFAKACAEYNFEHIAEKLPWEVLERFAALLTERKGTA